MGRAICAAFIIADVLILAGVVTAGFNMPENPTDQIGAIIACQIFGAVAALSLIEEVGNLTALPTERGE